MAVKVEVLDRAGLAKGFEALVRAAAAAALEVAGGRLDELSVVILGDEEMVGLNHRLLGRRWTTDVIAFEAEQDPDAVRSEIYINADAARRQAPEYGHSFEQELCFLVAHGVLHALGYDDTDEDSRAHMLELQTEAVRRTGA
ncbi:MAG: rRNA maturation RNase YbeY [Armatimonadetes bacterium]|nr:rRNA maturation RNase YbeY [Armatimonadota bacterium]